MGMQVGKQGGVKTDINVTPLIDVVLVLLIIFLVTMPIMMRTISLNVPRKITDQETTEQKVVTVTIKADFSAEIDTGERVITASEMEIASKLVEVLANKVAGDKVVFVDFEDPVPWEHVVQDMDWIRSVAGRKNKEGWESDVKVALKVKSTEGQETPPPQ